MKRWRGHSGAMVLNAFQATPVMHIFGGVYTGNDGERHDFTLCGRQAADHSPYLLVRHLAKFARPCGTCDRIAARKEAA